VVILVFQVSSLIMNYKLLGRSTLRISVTGFGCMSLKEGDPDSARLIHRAIESGVNFFDTADLYENGLNEERVGRILEGKRERVVLATKVGNEWRADGSGWDWNPRKGYILRAVEASLRRLRTDRIDLYQLHGGTINDPIDETIEAFELLQQQGKILFYGISSIRPDVIREYIRRSGTGSATGSGTGGGGGSSIVSVMMQYSLADRRPEESCLAALAGAGIGVLARGTVMKGMLAGKKAAPYLGHSSAEMEAAAAVLRGVAGDGIGGPGVAQLAIRWVLENPAITSAVVGIRTMEQLEDAVAAGDGHRLGGEEVQLLRTALKQQRYEEHR
jgi:aryl-alcohol dehydrogenase-like predicted oxidoreductase